MAASRVQRWAVLLSGYTYDIEFVPSKSNGADGLSRLPSSSNIHKDNEVTYIHFVEDFLPVTNREVKAEISKDRLLSRVLLYVQSGWPEHCNEDDLKPYFMKRNELYIENGCIMWGYRIIIPNTLQSVVLKQLHSSHMGIVKTKSLARSYIWWPNIDKDVAEVCRRCDTCAAESAAPPRVPPQPWHYAVQPWTRLHIDFLEPIKGKTYLVLIDSSSKWLEIFEMPLTNAAQVIHVLRATFARFGLPVELASDQGPPFASSEFSIFLKQNGIRQIFLPTYHPSSNGAAENAVKSCKMVIKKAYRDNVDVDAALQNFLLVYRNTSHSTTGETPAMLLQRRTLRNRLDLLRGDCSLKDRVNKAKRCQIEYAGGVQRELHVGETVWARNYSKGDKWEKGTVACKVGSRQYIIETGNGRQTTRHIDQIKRRSRFSDVTGPELTDTVEENPYKNKFLKENDVEDVGPTLEKNIYDKPILLEEDKIRQGD
ncbi:hypothetical protein O3G_MSEX009875 [Manduca sexta]|uniref:RNA-directed DNA polymerase n=1 Tax=Manduca sexta TaxID=7130 RepID=A0A921ZEU9_MANSE|nr:hypothetical protein O3G_MSEX009875 [Manduca sexta]